MANVPYVVVIGAANMDISGKPLAPLRAHDSNPGTVRLSHGGVGRNIAHNLALLGTDVRLITVFGTDQQADSLTRGCQEAGIDISASFAVAGAATSSYLFVLDETGDMEVAINDMAILEELTPERVAAREELLDGAAAIVAEANLPAATLAWISGHARAPLFCDPISAAKAPRLTGALGHIHTLKPNRLEAEALSGVAIEGERGLQEAADALLARGLGRAFVSLGADGLLCAEHGRSLRMGRVPATLVNATGAGDAMTAAIVWAHLRGLDLEGSGRAGMAAAAIAVESETTVSPQMSEGRLLARMQAYGPAGELGR